MSSMTLLVQTTDSSAARTCAAPAACARMALAASHAGPSRHAPEKFSHGPDAADFDAWSSASTPPPDVGEAECGWVPRKRARRAGGRRVCISDASSVRYIATLCHDAPGLGVQGSGCAAGQQAPARSADPSGSEGRPDGCEDTKYMDGPAPEAVVVNHLLSAVAVKNDATSVCPILKTLVKTGARELLGRVRERLRCMGERVGRRGKISVLPSSTLAGPEACTLLHFLQESVSRSCELVDKFQDRDCPAFEAVDADLDAERRNTAAALVLLGKNPQRRAKKA
jgi:hypothetical protein